MPDDEYPPYEVRLITLGVERVMTGTHFSTIETLDPNLTIRLEHVDTEFEDGPVLKITIAKKP